MYKFKEGSRIPSSIDANQVVSEFEKIREKYGSLEARFIVDESRDENHLLHPYFEWDNNKAADKYREGQARQLTRFIVEVKENEPETRVYYCVKTESKGDYRPVDQIVQVKSESDIALANLLRQLHSLANSVEEYLTVLKRNGKKPTKVQKLAFNSLKKAKSLIAEAEVA